MEAPRTTFRPQGRSGSKAQEHCDTERKGFSLHQRNGFRSLYLLTLSSLALTVLTPTSADKHQCCHGLCHLNDTQNSRVSGVQPTNRGASWTSKSSKLVPCHSLLLLDIHSQEGCCSVYLVIYPHWFFFSREP